MYYELLVPHSLLLVHLCLHLELILSLILLECLEVEVDVPFVLLGEFPEALNHLVVLGPRLAPGGVAPHT
jgi:hypothetical protein